MPPAILRTCHRCCEPVLIGEDGEKADVKLLDVETGELLAVYEGAVHWENCKEWVEENLAALFNKEAIAQKAR